jgi:hypothetical protein
MINSGGCDGQDLQPALERDAYRVPAEIPEEKELLERTRRGRLEDNIKLDVREILC